MPGVIRRATTDDVPDILRHVQALADYQGHREEAVASATSLGEALFPPSGHARVFAHVADVDGEIVGIAVWFTTYSTWTGRHGVWLEDLHVDPGHRGTGTGLALLRALAAECAQAGYPRLEWHVARWNEPSIAFYESLGAVDLHEQRTYRLAGDALHALAGAAEAIA